MLGFAVMFESSLMIPFSHSVDRSGPPLLTECHSVGSSAAGGPVRGADHRQGRSAHLAASPLRKTGNVHVGAAVWDAVEAHDVAGREAAAAVWGAVEAHEVQGREAEARKARRMGLAAEPVEPAGRAARV